MSTDGIDETALEAARLAIEDELIDWRDNMRFMLNNNGFVVKERDGSPSSVIRFGTEFGLRIGIRAYLDALGDRFLAAALAAAFPPEHLAVLAHYVEPNKREARMTHRPIDDVVLSRLADAVAEARKEGTDG